MVCFILVVCINFKCKVNRGLQVIRTASKALNETRLTVRFSVSTKEVNPSQKNV